jgi:peptidoglycan/LPS O-acetylase OafA/YrhL
VLIGAFWICQDMFAFTTAVVGYPLLGLGFGMLVLAALSPGSLLAKHRVPGATAIATLAYSTYLTHKEIMRLDRVYLAPHWQWKGVLGLAAYFLTFAVAAAVLYFAVERPFLKLRDRWLGSKLKTHSALGIEPSAP